MDAKGDAFVTGSTNATTLPLVNPLLSTLPSSFGGYVNEGFISVLNPSGSGLLYSTYFGGSTQTIPVALAVGPAGNAIVTGYTSDTDFPTTPGAFQRTLPQVQSYVPHAFVTKFDMSKANPSACFAQNALYFGNVVPGQSSMPRPLKLTNCGALPLEVGDATIDNPLFAIVDNDCTTLQPEDSCTVHVRYSPVVASYSDIGTLTIKDNAPINSQKIQLQGAASLPSISIYAFDVTMPDEVVGLKSFPLSIEISSNSFVPLHITEVQISGDFAVDNQCPAELFGGQYCNVNVTFTPKAAGLRTGTLSVYDDAYGSPQTVSFKGMGIAKYPTPIISFVSPEAAQVGSSAIPIYVSGTNIFSTSKLTLNGTPVTITGKSQGSLQATIPASLLKTMSSVAVQIVNPAPGGASSPFYFSVYQKIAVGAADILFEPFTRKFYATIPAASATNPNSLITIDPVTGSFGAPISIGNDPGALGLSSDGTMLYVSLKGDSSIVPFNVSTQKAGAAINLPSDPQKTALFAQDIQVQPDHSDNLIATLFSQNSGADGVAWIKAGKTVTTFLNEPPTNVTVSGTKFANQNDVLGWSNYYNGFGIEHFVITNSGLLEAPGIQADYGSGPIDTDGKNIYNSNGQVFSLSSGAQVGLLGGAETPYFGASVLTEHNSGRTFVLNQNDGITIFDSTTFTQVGATGIDNGYAPTNRLQHWGANGLSFFANNGFGAANDLILLRSTWLYPSPGPNPVPKITSVTPSPVTSKGPNFFLTVNGSSFTRGAVVQWNGVTRTTAWVSDKKLVADIQASEIKKATTAKITVVNPGPAGGPSASVSLTVK